MDPRLGVPPRASDVSMLDEAYRVAWPTQRSATPVAIPGTGRRLSDQAFRNIAARTAQKPSKPLVELVERFSLADALGEGAPAGTIAYLEKVAEVLEDGILTAQEALDLREVSVLERYAAAPKALGATPPKLAERLAGARARLAKNGGKATAPCPACGASASLSATGSTGRCHACDATFVHPRGGHS